VKKISFIIIVFLLVNSLFISCKNINIQEAKKINDNSSPSIRKEIKDYYALFNNTLTIVNETKNKKVEKLLYDAFGFLVTNFGQPRYHGKVTVYILTKTIKYPHVSWFLRKPEERTMKLSDFYMFKSELPTIIHELFHALYQTNNVVKKYPEFITEGMAIYVENLYKYQKNIKIKNHFEKIIKEEDICGKLGEKFDFSLPFQSYKDKRTIYYLYTLSGYFYSLQKEPIKLIKNIINDKDKILNNKKITIYQLMNIYKLKKFPCKKINIRKKKIDERKKKVELEKK
jgi:hypothetical protein